MVQGLSQSWCSNRASNRWHRGSHFTMKSQRRAHLQFSPLSSFQPADKCAHTPPSPSGSGAGTQKTLWVGKAMGIVCFQLFWGLRLLLKSFLKALLFSHRPYRNRESIVLRVTPKALKRHFRSAKEYFDYAKQMSHYSPMLLILTREHLELQRNYEGMMTKPILQPLLL